MTVNARSVALDVLCREGRTTEDLDRALAASDLDARDRSFATELAYGTLKMRRPLEWAVARFLHRPLDTAPLVVRWILLLGAYQLLYLERVPAHSAVDESVELARHNGAQRSAGFINAVLRKVAAEKPLPPPPSAVATSTSLGLYASLPDWIAQLLVERFGSQTALTAADGMNRPARRALRFVSRSRSAEHFAQQLAAEEAEVTRGTFGIPECIVVKSAPRGDSLRKALASGEAAWQSEESQLAVHLLAPAAGDAALDVCAGRGGKSMMFASRVGPDGSVWAIDDDRARLEVLTGSAHRAGLHNVRSAAADARRPYPPGVPLQFDVALVDAPCSGLGVLGRNADARWRKRDTDPQRFAAAQSMILERASAYVKPGGRLLYATCTFARRENDDVAERFLSAHDDWSAKALPSMTGTIATGPYLQVVPGIDGADGFFYALLERSSAEKDGAPASR